MNEINASKFRLRAFNRYVAMLTFFLTLSARTELTKLVKCRSKRSVLDIFRLVIISVPNTVLKTNYNSGLCFSDYK